MIQSIVLGMVLLLGGGVADDEASAHTRTEDVIYGRKFGTALTLDVFQPKQGATGAAAIAVISGGWYSDHRGINAVSFQELLGRGYTVFAVVHGSNPKFTIPEVVEDMNRAVRFIRHHADDYGINKDKIGIFGFSAGGHLSLMLGTAGTEGKPDAPDPVDRESSRVAAVVAFFPPTDFLNYGREGEDAIGRGVLKDFKSAFDFHRFDNQTKTLVPVTEETEIVEIGKAISPITHVTADDPPTRIIHGDADLLVPIQQAQILVEKMTSTGLTAELITKEGKAHGWPDIGKDLVLIADWFDKYLQPAAAEPAAK